jgi:FixJ family two-component response regulator
MPSQQTTVAIIDDDPGMRSATASLLSAFGYGTETFGSGEEFLNAAATSAATCLVVDIKLGNISGLDLVRQLAAAGIKLPVIFMTGCADEAIRSQATQLGCCIAYLKKPFAANLLIEGIIRAIG